MGLALQQGGQNHSGLYEIDLELQRDYKAVHRCLQTQDESRCSEELPSLDCGYRHTTDQFIHGKEGRLQGLGCLKEKSLIVNTIQMQK